MDTGMKSILIIEDDDQLRTLLQNVLLKEGYTIFVAGNGNEGVLQAREKRPDLIITDIIMPEKEGLETIIDIRKEIPHVKIIAMSGGGTYSDLSFLDVAKRLGAQQTLSKPFSATELREAVHQAFSEE